MDQTDYLTLAALCLRQNATRDERAQASLLLRLAYPTANQAGKAQITKLQRELRRQEENDG